MPHRTQMQIISRRLAGKEGNERLREMNAILKDLPDYKNGPYGDLRKWVVNQIEETRKRGRVVHRDSIAIRREGVAQIALVGPPNAGKSSLLQALSEIQIKIGDYAFTTLRPVPALVRIGGVLVQLVEIPGLLEGAAADRGGGRALLGVLRGADAIAFCQEARGPIEPLATVRAEVSTAGIDAPALIAATKSDEADAIAIGRLQEAYPDLEVVPVSVLDEMSLDRFKAAVWRLTGLVRVYLRHLGKVDGEPVAVTAGATVLDVARQVHNELALTFTGARIWGPSARFDGQRVGREHEVAEGDVVEIL